jgi:O-antigen/teichoic acid export membrane protein
VNTNTWNGVAGGIRWLWWDYVWILAAQGAFALSTLLGLVLSARTLGPHGYGTVALFVGVIQLLFVVGVKWCFPSILRFGREALIRDGAGGRAVWSWMPIFIASLALLALGLAASSGRMRDLVGLDRSYLWLAVFLFFSTGVGMVVVQLLQMQGSMRIAAWVSVAGRVIFAGLLCAVVVLHAESLTPVTVILFSALALATQALLGLIGLKQQVFDPVRIDWRLTGTMTRYSLPLVFALAAAYVSDWIDLYFLRVFRGHSEAGVYQVSYQALLFVAGGLVAMSQLAVPLLVAWRTLGREDRTARYVLRLIPQVAVLWSLCVIVIGIFQRPFFSLLFGAEFSESGRLFSILLIGMAFQAVTYLYDPLFFAYDVPGRATVIAGLAAGVNVLGDLALVPGLGAEGAALSTSASFALSAWLHLRWGNRWAGVNRLAAFVPPSLAALAMIVTVSQSTGARAVVLVGTSLLLVGWARRQGIFRPDDLDVLAEVELPSPVGALMTRVYRLLSQER